MSDDLRLVVRLVISLLIIIALMWLFYRVLAIRMGKDKQTADVSFTVLATRRLTRRATLMVVRVQGTTLLLGITDQHVTRLADLTEEPPDYGETGLAANELTPDSFQADSRGKHAQHSESSPLEGSIISPDTWKKAWEVVRTGAHE
jgi:flagellar biogenesis protein FliO